MEDGGGGGGRRISSSGAVDGRGQMCANQKHVSSVDLKVQSLVTVVRIKQSEVKQASRVMAQVKSCEVLLVELTFKSVQISSFYFKHLQKCWKYDYSFPCYCYLTFCSSHFKFNLSIHNIRSRQTNRRDLFVPLT